MDEAEVLLQIAKLKAQNRRLAALTISFGVLFALILWIDHMKFRHEVKTHQLVLLDASGASVGRLRNEGAGACLDLMGPLKTAVAAICAADNLGSYVSLSNRDGEVHAVLSTGINLRESVEDRFPPGILVSTRNGQKLLRITVGPESRVSLGDSSEKNALIIIIPAQGDPSLVLKGDEKVISRGVRKP